MERIVYHGSPRGDIKELLPRRSTHQKECIYATNNKTVALLFMGKGRGDLDTMIGTHDGSLYLVERRPNILKSLYDKEGYLYELDGSTFKHYDYLWSQEVISFESSVSPLSKTFIPNILESLEKEAEEGHITIYKYPRRPDNVPLDNSDLIDKYIGFEKSGLTGAVNDLLEVYPEFKDEIAKRLKEENKNL